MKRHFFIAASALAIASAFPAGASADVTISTNAMVTLSTASCLAVDGSVIISSGMLTAGPSQILVSQDWINHGSFVSSGSTVAFTGAVGSTSTIIGQTSFTNFQSTVPAKNLVFESGSTTTVTGLFFLQGQVGQLIQVKSSADGVPSFLVNSGSNTVSYTFPKDNYAGGGNAILAGLTSIDGGNTVNWFFGVPAPSSVTVNGVFASSMSVVWTSTSPSEGYVIQASTASNYTGTVTQVSLSSSVSTGFASPLQPNTTYYLQVGNTFMGTTSYAQASPNPISTLAVPVSSASIAVLSRSTNTVSISWTPLPVSPSTATAEGYRVRASTSSDFTGTIFTTSTTNVSLSSLTVSGLTSGTTYYFEVGSLNWAGLPNYAGPVSTVTLVGSAPVNPTVTVTSTTFITVAWGPSAGTPDNYVIQASTDSGFGGTVIEVSTPALLSTGTVTPLQPNTTYYLQVGANFSGTTSYALVTPSPISTLAVQVDPLSIVISSVTASDATLYWNGLPIAPPTATSEGYVVQASTASDFTGTLYSASTSNVLTTTLTVSGLSPSTTYYFRVGTLNWASVPNFVIDGSTVTPASLQKPRSPGGFYGDYINNQFTTFWHAVTQDTNGSPISIASYRVLVSTGINGIVTSTITVSSSVFSALDPSAPTQFYRVYALGTNGVASDPSDYVDNSIFNQYRYILDPLDPQNRLLIPSDFAQELRSENNSYGSGGADIDIRLDRVPGSETGEIRGYYDLYAVYHDSPTQRISNFSFTYAGPTLELIYSAALPTEDVQLYWQNGGSGVPLATQSPATNTAFSIQIRNLGVYYIAVASPASSFRLLPNFPRPRVLNPRAGVNSRTFWSYQNPNGDIVRGKIYDIRGAIVRNLSPDNTTQPDTLAWDGRSDNGAVVPTGVYIYKIEAGEVIITGTVVVAR